METKDIAQKIAAAANDKKAKDILLLNMEGLSPVTDFMLSAVPATAPWLRQLLIISKISWQKQACILLTRKAMPTHVGYCWITVMLLLTFSWRKNAIFII